MGQANSIAAVSYALHELRASEPDIEVHLVSFNDFKSPVPSDVMVHAVSGTGIMGYVKQQLAVPGIDPINVRDYYTHAPGFWSNLKFVPHLSIILHPEEPSEYLKTVFELVNLINKLQPDICVLDPIFDAGADAVAYCGRKSVKLVPMDARYACPDAQGGDILKQPCMGTGFQYPLTFRDQILNLITLVFTALWAFVLDPKFRRLNKARRTAGLNGPLGFLAPSKGTILSMSADPKLEIPSVIPPNITSCGPILLPNKSVDEIDPDLAEWLTKGPIILVVLGSHVKFTKEELLQIKECFSVVLSSRKDLRLLWKAPSLEGAQVKLDDIAEPSRVRIVDWLKPDPIAVLQTEQVAVFVNHGGSNSYHEALMTGTPQLILSGWADCHDNANLIEWLGIGAWGNRKASPAYDAKEMIKAFDTVLGTSPSDPGVLKIRKRASECKALIDAHWTRMAGGRQGKDGKRLEGRDFAALKILELAGKE